MKKTRLGKMPYVIILCLVLVLVLLASGLGFIADMPLKGLDPDDVTSITLSDAMGVNDPVALEDEDRDPVLAALTELRGRGFGAEQELRDLQIMGSPTVYTLETATSGTLEVQLVSYEGESFFSVDGSWRKVDGDQEPIAYLIDLNQDYALRNYAQEASTS